MLQTLLEKSRKDLPDYLKSLDDVQDVVLEVDDSSTIDEKPKALSPLQALKQAESTEDSSDCEGFLPYFKKTYSEPINTSPRFSSVIDPDDLEDEEELELPQNWSTKAAIKLGSAPAGDESEGDESEGDESEGDESGGDESEGDESLYTTTTEEAFEQKNDSLPKIQPKESTEGGKLLSTTTEKESDKKKDSLPRIQPIEKSLTVAEESANRQKERIVKVNRKNLPMR